MTVIIPVRKLSIFILCTLLLAFSCKKKAKNTNDNPVPSVPVNLTIYPGDPLNFKLQAIGGWMYFSGGINGVVVYRKSEQEFVAIERSSSHLPNDPKASVQVQSNNFTLRDTISGSEWRIFDGTVTKGPAEWPLRLYGANFDGNALRVTN